MPQKRKRKEGVYQRNDSPYWWATWTDETGRRHSRSTKTSSKRDALTELYKLKSLSISARTRYTLNDIINMYVVHKGTIGQAVTPIVNRVATFYRYLSPDERMPLSRTVVRKYITSRLNDGAKPATVNSELSTIGAIHNWASIEMETNWVNPCRGQILKNPNTRTRWFSHDEFDAIIDVAKEMEVSDWLPDLVIFAVHTGMRVSEILNMRWEDIQLGHGVLILPNQKNRKLGSVALNTTARALLSQRARNQIDDYVWPLRDRVLVHRWFKRACSRAGVKDGTVHDLRRTCGSWMLQKGVSIAAVSKVLRHSNIAITSRTYAHLAPEHVQDAVEVLVDEEITTPNLKIASQ